jgi:hypothetical protein
MTVHRNSGRGLVYVFVGYLTTPSVLKLYRKGDGMTNDEVEGIWR